MDRRVLADSRRWVCSRATGDTLEVAIGTGLNLPHYPPGLRITGVDWSAEMVRLADERAARERRPVSTLQADAADLPFPDASFDSFVCTFSMCCIPDLRGALREAARVLRPGGRLLLADHVVSTNPLIRAAQHVAETVSVPLRGEHYTRRPLPIVHELGLEVVATERLTAGMVERVHATRR